MKKCRISERCTLIITFARVRHLESLFALSEESLDSQKGEEDTQQVSPSRSLKTNVGVIPCNLSRIRKLEDLLPGFGSRQFSLHRLRIVL